MSSSNVFLTVKRAALGLALPLAGLAFFPAMAAAQPVPSYAQPQPPPSYAQPDRHESVLGTVYSINGKYNITVRDSRGYLDNVSLHDGTIINPTGWRLRPGDKVTISGIPSGHTFAADEIDTPYSGYPSYYRYPGHYRAGFGFGF
jgi:hypothetical protein